MSKHEVPMDWEKGKPLFGVPVLICGDKSIVSGNEAFVIATGDPREQGLIAIGGTEGSTIGRGEEIRNIANDPDYLAMIARDQQQDPRAIQQQWQIKCEEGLIMHTDRRTEKRMIRALTGTRWQRFTNYLRRKLREFREFLT